ncbi:two-component system sensor histidine kinase NtrB [Solidesulfovibrio magneticus]|uniref:histidine kinase n=1 Tax=Solidesulfovibrio magneticus (strain ATCC 700980 / DSM 13731 / RS-1) TaxID=573370 RepID=C4XSV6_SOLM1|nr:ATP-binding protein [Solidesulfovibrio magneticus]BAH75798.1 putative sensor histidine kinase [Solidesulfovibrio magneticus RS-1]
MPSVRQILVQNVIKTIPVGLLVIGPRGTVIAASPSAAYLLGLPEASLEGCDWHTLLLPAPANESFNRNLVEAVESGRPYRQCLADYQRPDGEMRRFSMTATCPSVDGKPIGVTLLFDDVTALYRSRERENAALREKNRLQHDMIESLNNLALSVAHQVRNPAAAIGGFALKLLRDHKERRLPVEYPEIIFQEARRLEDLVGAVVRLSTLGSPRFAAVRLGRLVEEALSRAARSAEGLHKRLESHISLEDVEIVADEALLSLALDEVLLNAVEFSGHERVRVSINLARRDDVSQLTVADDGPGVRPELRSFVFDPFFTTKARGAGIGLTLARKAVLEHNGEIDLRQGDGGGAVVAVRLFDTPEAGLGREAFYGPMGLDVRELMTKARELGLDVSGLTTIDAVRSIQQREGFAPCFAWGVHDRCGQELCAFRRECVKTLRIDDGRRFVYGGS